MRILYFTNGQSPHDLRFTNALAQTQHEIYVLCLDGIKSGWPENVIQVPWQPVGKGWRGILRQVVRLKKVIREITPDLIHAGPIQGPAFLSALAGFHPLVTMSWGFDLLNKSDQNWLWWVVTRFVLRRTDVLVGDCDSIFHAAAKFGFSSDRYRKFPWGVDLDHFKPNRNTAFRRELGWYDNIVLLCNRAMEPQYGVDVAVNGFIAAYQKNKNLRLLLFGKGSQSDRIHRLVSDAGLEGVVHFGGYANLSDLPSIYNSVDLFLTASHTDGSSVSLMEALACGLPAIVSDIPANLEWICHGREGWVFEDGNANDLGRKIIQAVESKTYWLDIAKNNRKLAEEMADWAKNFPVLLQAYQQALTISGEKRL